MNRIAPFLVGLLLGSTAGAQPRYTRSELAEDFESLWTTVREQYAYWPEKATDWDCVREKYRPALDTIHSRSQFTGFLEGVLRELYDQHVGLNTNTPASYRLVPTGADLALRLEGDRVFVSEVRPGAGAERAGIRAGMELLAVNGLSLEEAVRPLLPRCLQHADSAARLFALQLLAAAGTHNGSRRLALQTAGGRRDFEPDRYFNTDTLRYEGLLQARVLSGNIGYIRVNNSLGDEDLIPAFDSALNTLLRTRGLIIDLRETPSGGGSTVARALMGRLLRKEGFYQKHELPADSGRWGVKRSWAEIVTPRGPAYTAPVAVLAGAWTGSMGEGIVVGLHSLRRAQVFGHPMAALNGAIYSFRLPKSGIGYNLSAERLYHMNGTARERFRAIRPPADRSSGDPVLAAAAQYLDAAAH